MPFPRFCGATSGSGSHRGGDPRDPPGPSRPGCAPCPGEDGAGTGDPGPAAPRPAPSVPVTVRTTNFPSISHFPKIKPEDSCECNRSLQKALAERSIKVDISRDLFLFYFFNNRYRITRFSSGGQWPAELKPE